MSDSTIRALGIDAIRGLMILWMLVVHVSLTEGTLVFGLRPGAETTCFPWALMSFFVAPFFFFSGYLFRGAGDVGSFVLGQMKKLLLPYLFFTLLGLFIYLISTFLQNGRLDFSFLLSGWRTMAFRSNGPMWFLFSLFVVKSVVGALGRLKWSGVLMGLYVLVCLVVGILTCNRKPVLGMGNMALGSIFFVAGMLLHRYERFGKWILMVMVPFFLLMAVLCPPMHWLVRNILVRGDLLQVVVYNIAACVVLWGVFQRLLPDKAILRPLAFVGCHSLVIYAGHRPFLNFIMKPIWDHWCSGGGYWVFLGASLLAIVVWSLSLEWLLVRIAPWGVGRRGGDRK